MSWDIMLGKPLAGTATEQFDEDNLETFDLTLVKGTLETLCPQITQVRPLWMNYEASCFEIDFDLTKDIIMMHVHILDLSGDEQFMSLLEGICKVLHCRAFDTTSGNFLV